jgi:hypothetical protein
VCKRKILGLCGNTINVCGMRYMSLSKEAVVEATTVFRAVKMLFNDMNKLEYESVKRMVVYLRVCMDLLYWKIGETWEANMGWEKNAKFNMEIVTGRLNQCYEEYEAENSCDLPFDLYEGFVDLLEQCRMWMRKLIKEEPEWEEDGMELGPVRRVTREEYEGRRRVDEGLEDAGDTGDAGEGRGREYEFETESNEDVGGLQRAVEVLQQTVERDHEIIEGLRNEVSELRNRIEKLERAKSERVWSRLWGGSDVRKSSLNGGNGVDMETLLCRLNEMNF